MPTFGATNPYDCRPFWCLPHPQIRIVQKAAYDLVFR
jgi:hypothetical protein